MEKKIIPYSLEAEEALLGTIMLYPEALQDTVNAGITSLDFYLDKNKTIYKYIYNMFDNREKVDSISLSNKLKDFDEYDKIGGMDYLLKLTDSVVSGANAKEYIRIIKNKSLSRQIIKAGEEIALEGFNGKGSIDDALEKAEKRISDIIRNKTASEFKTGAEVFDAALDKVEKIQKAGTTITGVKTYYSDFDNLTTGLQKGDLIILAARPSMGKTALALNIALNAAQSAQGAVCIFSLEMPADQLASRMLSAKAKVEGQKLRQGRVSQDEWERLREANQELKTQKFYIDDTPGARINDMKAKCHKLVNDCGVSLVIIDYIQLITLPADRQSDSRQQEVSEISRNLKSLARELNVPVIALSQLSRSVEKREDKRPMLSDLRESGSIEQDADLVLFIYREDYYAKEEDKHQEREDVELLVAKHRNGPTGTVKLAFEKEINAFYGIAKDK